MPFRRTHPNCATEHDTLKHMPPCDTRVRREASVIERAHTGAEKSLGETAHRRRTQRLAWKAQKTGRKLQRRRRNSAVAEARRPRSTRTECAHRHGSTATRFQNPHLTATPWSQPRPQQSSRPEPPSSPGRSLLEIQCWIKATKLLSNITYSEFKRQIPFLVFPPVAFFL